MAQRVMASHKVRARRRLLTEEDYAEEAQMLLCNHGKAIDATNLAFKRNLHLPKDLYEGGLKICILKADVSNAIECLYRIKRAFTDTEFKRILEGIIAAGDIKGLADLQNINSKVFALAIWQNTIILRVRRLS